MENKKPSVEIVDLDAQRAAFDAVHAAIKDISRESQIRVLASVATMLDLRDSVVARLS